MTREEETKEAYKSVEKNASKQLLSMLPPELLPSYEPLFKTMKEKGITSYRLFKMGFPQSNYYAIKHGENISTNTINQLCVLLQCEVSDILKFLPEDNN